ncbi:sulfite exporter TauE/SafE family protein [Cyanobium sp. Morenito 9A2]|uniref:sulfite exporter TauE/SafE family protein n=1 Tax=Cyanobium sp. Morenito 9A2 TaxID=2823718 RepID=UPI0020CD41C9|nr:sulfite exporter TauE/SafE family protein [Cyanobium sp. Morenito 9A2]MCP9848913.1 sulfite exporter TauE/SafE family protein [Cyanobium sp. Morenito 9A2]
MEPSTWLLAALAAVAFLYAGVGHAGASGYIAVLALAGFSAAEIRPLALVLNVLVAGLASWQFIGAGHFRRAVFLPLALASVPAALVGGMVALPGPLLQRLIGVVLLLSAWRLLRPALPEPSAGAVPGPLGLGLTGGLLGLLAGLTGTGGGIFLTPLLILRGWLAPRQAAAISAPFILVNSLAGLTGLLIARGPAALPSLALVGPMALAVALAGALGAYGGSRRFSPLWIRRLLALVLVVASGKLLGLGG